MCVFFTLNRYFCPVDIQHNQSVPILQGLEEIQVMWSQSYATEIVRCHVPVCSKHKHWTMRCHAIILDTADTTYTFYEIEKRKKTKKKLRKNKETQIEKVRKNKIKKGGRNKLSRPPRRGSGSHLKITSWKKKKKEGKNTTACEQSRTNNHGSTTVKPNHEAPSYTTQAHHAARHTGWLGYIYMANRNNTGINTTAVV